MHHIARTALAILLVATSVAAAPPVRSGTRRATRPYDVRHYRLLIRLDPRTGSFSVSTAITFQVTAPTAVLELDAVGLEVRGAWLLSRPGDPERGQATTLPFTLRTDRLDETQSRLLVTLPLRLLPGSEATVELSTQGVARTGPGGEPQGLFQVVDPEHQRRPPLYLTRFAPASARRFFPCHDDPADKATFDITVETDAKLTVLTNGRLLSAGPVPGLPGKQQVRYTMNRPMAPYLLALAIGPFDREVLDDGSVPLDAYLVRDRRDAALFALEAAREAMHSFQRFLDLPYPYERYSQVEAPLLPAPVLENTLRPCSGQPSLSFLPRATMVLPAPDAQLQRLPIAGAVAHELAHQWFGDLVTMRWWDDIWLHEALATYLSWRYLKERYGEEALLLRTLADVHDGYFRTDEGPRSHPIIHRDLQTPEEAFDAITSLKGAQVLRMIEELLGEERMAAGLSAYLRQNAYRSAASSDLLQALLGAQQGGPPRTPVTEFARSWLEARGHPILTVGARYDAARKATVLSVRQRPSHASDDTRWHVRLPVTLHHRGPPRFAVETVVVLDRRQQTTVAVPTPAPPEWVSWNRGGLVLTALEVPGVPEATWVLQAQSDPDPAARFQALLQLLRPSLQKLSPMAQEALGRALTADPVPELRYQLARRLVRLPGTLPAGLARAVLEAGSPGSPGFVDPTDPLAVLLSRAAGVLLLAKVPGPEAEKALAELLRSSRTPIDLVAPAAEALARRGDEAALVLLEEGIKVQKRRGLAYLGRVLGAYGALGNPARIRDLVRVVRDHAGNTAIVSEVLRGLFHNEELRQSGELPQAIADLVLGDPPLTEEQQARALTAIEGLRTREARAVLESVMQRARPARIRGLANLLLSRTFL